MDWASFYKDDYVRTHKMLFSFGLYFPKNENGIDKNKEKAERQ